MEAEELEKARMERPSRVAAQGLQEPHKCSVTTCSEGAALTSEALTCWLCNTRTSGMEAQNLHKSHVGEHGDIPQCSLIIPSTYAHDILTCVREAFQTEEGQGWTWA